MLVALHGVHDRDHGAGVDAAAPADDALGEDAEVLHGLAEDDNYAAEGRLVDGRAVRDNGASSRSGIRGSAGGEKGLADEDGYVGPAWVGSTQREEDFLYAQGLEAVMNDGAGGRCGGREPS